MTTRRNLIIGAACLAGAGTAYGLRPRRHVSLLKSGHRVDDLVPQTCAGWSSRNVSDLVAPEEGSLSAKLYGQTVGRVYSLKQGGPEIMMLLAYGDTQSDDLQLHRPEVCYPAFGFAITRSDVFQLPLGGGVTLPTRKLVADAPDRRETILYWSRLGEYLPLDRKQQQIDRLRTAAQGDIADGILARFSVNGADTAAAGDVLGAFIPALIAAVAADCRSVLVGTERANRLAELKA